MKRLSPQYQFGPRSRVSLRKVAIVFAVSGVYFGWARTACAEFESGVYKTLPDATVEERGDRVPNGSRTVPISATLTFDLGASQPSLTAMIPNAVLEGGDPFALTARSSFGVRLADGAYQFRGDYLRDISPLGTQYLFDWKFSTSTDGGVAWNGITDWAGGHIWQVTISDVAIQSVPEPTIIALIGAGVGILWISCAGQKARGRIGPVVDKPLGRWGKELCVKDQRRRLSQ